MKVAITQFKMSWNIDENLAKAEQMVRKAAQKGAQVILLPELFKTPYFCQRENYEYFDLAEELDSSTTISRFQKLAKELNVVLPLSFFEKAGNVHFNSLVMIDADGKNLGLYRKSHIPTGECYEEKFYFSPGDTGFQVFKTKYGRVGVGICWDQWFPEVARSLALMGAQLIVYPTAIGTEPVLPKDSKDHWQNTMRGHAAANIVPVLASNRIGTESDKESSMTFFGSSFIADEDGNTVIELSRNEEDVAVAEFDLAKIDKKRIAWGVFRDRRPDLYHSITKFDDSKK
ncbi:MAG: N-carbamoylputrescine amidase [Epsilonproteobacteria bacterium]|nr:N-carbamoylputrescine amidase [Campylobacterota bacterium]